MGEPSTIACPKVNLFIQELLPDRNGSLKIGVLVAEDWPTWEIVLPSLGYQVLQIHVHVRFSKVLQGGTLSGTEWLPPNEVRRLRNLQDSWVFVSGSPSYVSHLWGGGINRYMTAVFFVCVV